MVTSVAILLPLRRPTTAAERWRPSAFVCEVGAVLRVHGTGGVLVATVLGLCWVGLGGGFSTLFLTHVRGSGPEDAGGILAISGVVGFSGAILVSLVADLIRRKPTVVPCALVGRVVYLLFALGDLAPMGLVLDLTLANFCIGGLSPLVGAPVPSELVPNRRGTAIGFNVFVAALFGIFLMPFLGGIASSYPCLWQVLPSR